MCTQLLLCSHVACGTLVSAASYKHPPLPSGGAGNLLPLEEVPAFGVGLSLAPPPFLSHSPVMQHSLIANRAIAEITRVS